MMNRSDVMCRFAALFDGRRDAFGTEDGGCIHVREIDEIAWRHRFLDHLRGERLLGVYPMFQRLDGWVVKWGASDLDLKSRSKPSGDYATRKEAHIAARNLQSAHAALGITAHIEHTRSGGMHVWVFAEEWVSASTMRRALLVAHQIAGVRPTEVNPKSESLPEGSVGNYLRLPYPRSLNADGVVLPLQSRVMLDEDGIPRQLTGWLSAAEQNLASVSTLKEAAALWTQSVPPEASLPELGEIPELTRTITDKLSGLSYMILTDGPLEGGDRSDTLYKLACNCDNDGLPIAEAVAVVNEADLRWGKFHSRPDGEKWIRRTVERAYTRGEG